MNVTIQSRWTSLWMDIKRRYCCQKRILVWLEQCRTGSEAACDLCGVFSDVVDATCSYFCCRKIVWPVECLCSLGGPNLGPTSIDRLVEEVATYIPLDNSGAPGVRRTGVWAGQGRQMQGSAGVRQDQGLVIIGTKNSVPPLVSSGRGTRTKKALTSSLLRLRGTFWKLYEDVQVISWLFWLAVSSTFYTCLLEPFKRNSLYFIYL